MKYTTFFFISLFFLTLAFFHQPLFSVFPQVFEPVDKFITEVGPAILYVAGGLAFIITMFTGLPTWASVVAFVAIILGGGFYLQDKTVSLKLEESSLFLSITPKISSPTAAPKPIDKQI